MNLPEDIMIEILLYFKYEELEPICLVSKRIYKIVNSYNFWNRKALFDFSEPLPSVRKLYTHIAQKHNLYYESKVPIAILHQMLEEKNTSLLKYYMQKNNIDYDSLNRLYAKYANRWYVDGDYKKEYKYYLKIYERIIKFVCKCDDPDLYEKIKFPGEEEEFDYILFSDGQARLLHYLNYELGLNDDYVGQYLTRAKYIDTDRLKCVLFNIAKSTVTDLILVRTFTVKQADLIEHLKMVRNLKCETIISGDTFGPIDNRTDAAIESIWKSIIYDLLDDYDLLKKYDLNVVYHLFEYIVKPFSDNILKMDQLKGLVNFKILLNRDFSHFDTTIISQLKAICYQCEYPTVTPSNSFVPLKKLTLSIPQIPKHK